MPTVDEMLKKVEAQRQIDGPLHAKPGRGAPKEPMEQRINARTLRTWGGSMADKMRGPDMAEIAAFHADARGVSASSMGSLTPAYYFCLGCRTIEVYDEVPQQGGSPMWPWHEHGGEQSLLRRMTPEDAHAAALRAGVPMQRLPRAVNTSPRIPQGGLRPVLADPGAERLQAIMTKVQEEGW